MGRNEIHWGTNFWVILLCFVILYKPAYFRLTFIEESFICFSILFSAWYNNKSWFFIYARELTLYGLSAIVLLIPCFMNTASYGFISVISNHCVFYMFPLLWLAIRKYLTKKDKKIILFGFFAITGYTIFTTIKGLQIYPFASRALAGWATIGQRIFYMNSNIGGYEFIYGTVFLVSILLLGVFKGPHGIVRKTAEILYALTATFMILKSQYTIAVILLLIACVLLLFYRGSMKRKFCVITIFTLVLILIIAFQDSIMNGLISFTSSLGMESYTSRLQALQVSLSGNIDQDFDRIRLYKLSLSTIVDYPVIGGMWFADAAYSNHSGLLDMVARYGIFIIPIVMYAKAIWEQYMNGIYNPELSHGLKIIYFVFLIFIFANTFEIYMDISLITFLILPLLISYWDEIIYY